MSETAQTYETPEDAGPGEAGDVRLWLEAIALQRKVEQPWRKRADEAVVRYRDEKERKGRRFNILFANTQTVLPAIYNSTPIPDIRRRFGDEDAVGRVVAQMLERALSYHADIYDFDNTMRAACWDCEVTGRGVARIRYEPTLAERDGEEYVSDEAVTCAYVDWRDFIVGPGRRWSEVPWVAFEHRLTREELRERFGSAGAAMPLDIVADGVETDRQKDRRDVPEVFKRGTVYEIWDKQAREVLFIAPTVPKKPLKREADPLRLREFFPVPRPLYSVQETGSLVPLVPFELYKDQAEELDRVTARITALVDVMRWRGLRDASIEWEPLANAGDGDLVPVQNVQQYLGANGGGGLDRAVWFMPIEVLVGVVKELVVHREEIKRVIYEITGLSDILRGASEAQETATAQRLKSQWGSLRIQDRQAEVQRFARDLFRLKAEIIAERFQPETLSAMTGIELPTAAMRQQAQMALQQGVQDPRMQAIMEAPATWEDVLRVLRTDALREYRVDIETDSTIQADVSRAQENAARFVEGMGSFIQAIGPAVQTGQIPRDVAADLMSAFSRSFKLGRQAEEAMEKLKNAPPPEQPDPMAGEREKLALERERMQAEMQMKQAEMQQSGQLEAQKVQATIETERMKAEAQIALEREKMAAEQQRHAETMQAERERAGVEMQMRQMEGERAAGLEREKMAATERQSAEAARAKAEPQQVAAQQISAVAEGVQQLGEAVQQIAQRVDALGQAVAEVADDMAAPVEAVRGQDGRIAEVRRGRRVLRVARGDDGRAAGLI